MKKIILLVLMMSTAVVYAQKPTSTTPPLKVNEAALLAYQKSELHAKKRNAVIGMGSGLLILAGSVIIPNLIQVKTEYKYASPYSGQAITAYKYKYDPKTLDIIKYNGLALSAVSFTVGIFQLSKSQKLKEKMAF